MNTFEFISNDLEITVKGKNKEVINEDLILQAIKSLIDSLDFRSDEEMCEYEYERYLQMVKDYADGIR
ncbi:hypothetical protein [Brevibacillus brevis]|uniref:hypothetical protein n=1 Tax=Brevibacillus brevis TaxID=1393 RepID=UPI00036FA65C|nr:hypothetical protein [Brevibacillus brevis]ATF13578.1 hypothetical protein A616_16810 [Brevibacillus brevis X23]